METQSDYGTGLGRLADPEDDLLPIAFETDYRFSDESRYDAIKQDSHQVELIATYEKGTGLRVYYQLYNPWDVPFEQRIPLAGYSPPEGTPDLGVRVIPASVVHERLASASTRSPALSDFEDPAPLPGLRLAPRGFHLRRGPRLPRRARVRVDPRRADSDALLPALRRDRRGHRNHDRVPGSRGLRRPHLTAPKSHRTARRECSFPMEGGLVSRAGHARPGGAPGVRRRTIRSCVAPASVGGCREKGGCRPVRLGAFGHGYELHQL